MAPDQDQLERECAVFTRFLARAPATPYVVGKYVAAHSALTTLTAIDAGDRTVARVAAWAPAMTRLADAYARLCAPRGLLRRKLTLLLAILETSPSLHRAIDVAPPRAGATIVLELALVGGYGLAAAVIGVLLLVPLRAAMRVLRRSHE